MAATTASSSGQCGRKKGQTRPCQSYGASEGERAPAPPELAARGPESGGGCQSGGSEGDVPLTALLHAAQALAGTLDPGRVEQMIVDEAVAALRADAAVLLGQAEVPGEYRVRAQCGLAATYGARVRVAASDAAGLAASTQVFSAAGGLPRWVRRLLSAGRSAAVTFVPLIFEGGVLGHLGLLSRAPLEAPDPEREGAVATFARLAAAALARAEHCRAMEQGAAESTLLLQIGQLLSATFDPDIMARILTDEARDLLEGDLAAFYLYEPVTDTMQLRALRGVSRERVEAAGLQRISLDCLPATRRAGASGQPVASQWPEDGDLIALFGPALRVRTSLTVPLRARGLPLGFLFVGRSARRPFDLAEAQLGFKLGALGALTLDNAQLYAGQSEQMKQLRAAQAQLIEAEKMASLGRIVAGVAHELNNPLAIISGYAQMLLADDVPPALRDGLERIDRGARRAAQVVRELLAFARQQPIAPTEIQVASLVREVLDRAEPAITTAGVEVELRIEDGLPPILGDRLQLARVLGELVEGALRAIASRPGAGKLTISATYRDGVSLAISDDGPGIAPGMLDKVFEPFATPGDSGPGSGLGLSMCYGVVRAHGGRISVANNRGPGATFYVELPAAGGG